MENLFMSNEKDRIKNFFQDDKFLKKCDNDFKYEKYRKSLKLCTALRNEAHECFSKSPHDENDHMKIWELYSKSIATAPSSSNNLIVSYYCRANFLYHLNKYTECLDDLNNALKINTSSHELRMMLLERQAKVSAILRNKHSQELSNTFLTMKYSDLTDEDGMSYLEKLKDLKIITTDDKKIESDKMKNRKKNYNFNLDFQNEIPCASTALKLNYDNNFGRHIVSARKISPGEVLAVEKLYSIIISKLYTHCSHCGSVAWASIPCDNCSLAMYCSLKCKKEAKDKYHDFECLVIDKLWNENEEIESLRMMLSVKLVLQAFKENNCNISELKNVLKEIDECKGF